jgi:AcrR family transcriptional regulator
MPDRAAEVRLGESVLGRHRHVCALFDGPDDAAAVLVPFVRDRLRARERVVHVVQAREPYAATLAAVLDVSAALDSGQLDVRTWDEAYLAGGSFSASRMLAYVRQLLREVTAPTFPAIRLIGDMGWTATGAPGTEELLAYETGLNRILARPNVAVVCAFDTSDLDSDLIPGLLAAHDAALVNGRLQRTPEIAPIAGPRERILAAAALLFAENGPGQTGVDLLIEAAGVAKATFYRHFPSKDALILAWLRDPQTRWFDRVRATAEARAATPGELVARLFDAVAEWLEAEDFLGCPYLNTAVEISSPGDPEAEAIRDYLGEIGAYLEAAVAAAGHRDADRLGRELHVLLAGSISLGVANRTSAHVRAARGAALDLLGARRPAGEGRRD